MIFENWYQLTQCSRQGDFKKVVFYQADRTISVASKSFSMASRDMIWVFDGLQMIISIFWNKRGGHSMLRTDSTDANVGPRWFFEFHTRSSVLNWVSKNGDIPQKSGFFAFLGPVEQANHALVPPTSM